MGHQTYILLFSLLNASCYTCTSNRTTSIFFLTIEPTRCINFSKFYFGMKLYMFRTVPLSVIRSFPLYTQQCYMSYVFADSLRAGSGRTSMEFQPSWQRNCPKHADFHSKIKFWVISASSWFCYKKFVTIHGHMNVKNQTRNILLYNP